MSAAAPEGNVPRGGSVTKNTKKHPARASKEALMRGTITYFLLIFMVPDVNAYVHVRFYGAVFCSF